MPNAAAARTTGHFAHGTRDGGAPWEWGGAMVPPAPPPSQPTTPALRLAWAVLEQAVHDLDRARRCAPRRREPRAGAVEAWFRGTHATWPFAFEPLCLHLGLDPSAVRRAIGIGGAPPPVPAPTPRVAHLARRRRA